jgi:uncharacterized protein YdeI (YjbR/CyaY-like superfamily)
MLHPKDQLPVMRFPDALAWEAFLHEQHLSAPGIWLQISKKGSNVPSVTYQEALDAALCYGWIDGQKGSWDAESFVQRFVPRRKRSIWSQINVAKVEALTAAGRMQPQGLKVVADAKANGQWANAYAPQSKMEVPEDLAAALAENPAAQQFFDGLNSVNRFAILFRLQQAKRPETRLRRIAEFVAMLARQEKIHP